MIWLLSCSPAFEDLPGNRVDFDVRADLVEDFHAMPWPLDTRLTDQGAPDTRGLPVPADNRVVAQLVEQIGETRRFSQVPTVFFRFEDPLTPTGLEDGVQPHAYFVRVEDGHRVPAYASTPQVDDYVSPNTLLLQPVHGFVLDAGTTWAAVVEREHDDLGSPAALQEALAGEGPLGAQFGALGMDAETVAAATVFTTSDAVEDTYLLTEAVRETVTPELHGFVFDEDHPRYCEVHASIDLPQLQEGEPPFDEDGTFVWDGARPAVQRVETAPVAISIPHGDMPAGGWPVVVYMHGSGGRFDQVVDRGPVTEEGGERTPGQGPAHTLAAGGIAAVGMATLLSPDRDGGQTGRSYLNLFNLPAYRDTWRQAMIDTRLLLDALETATVPDACGAEARFDASTMLVMGQSAGGHLSTEIAAIDPRVSAAVPTGSGGFWSLVLTTNPREGVPPELIAVALGTDVVPDAMHPGLAIVQQAWEAAEPLVYAPRIAHSPLHAPADLYVPASQDDGYFPEPVYDAMALAYGVELVGPALWPEMGERLELGDLDTDLAYPVTGNRGHTAAVNQWAPDGLVDSHNAFAQEPGIRHQYRCFFETHLATGTATLVAPGETDDAPCD